MNRHPARSSFIAKKSRPPSRLASLFDFIVRHAGAVAVDHVHILPLDPISKRTGAVAPRLIRRRCG